MCFSDFPACFQTFKTLCLLNYALMIRHDYNLTSSLRRGALHLNFGAINHLARQCLVRGLPKLKFEKDHLCSAYAIGKSKKKSHIPISEDTNQEKLYLLHMDLCGPMHVKSVNGNKYILVIVDDYSRFTWVKCLRSKVEALEFTIKFLKTIQVRLKVPVRCIRTDNVTEFVNQTLLEYYEQLMVMASEQSSSGPILHEMTHTTISSGLVPKPTSSTSFVPPSRNDWDLLFQPLFDELLTPPPSVDPPAPEVIALISDEEVYVSQPDGFVDQDNPNHMYKLKKALYGLKQAPRAWYDMLSSFLISQDFSKGSVDPTLFIQKSKLDEDTKGKAVDPSHYHDMIGTLLYLTASRPDLQFAICVCPRTYGIRVAEVLKYDVLIVGYEHVVMNL
uniref:Integrase catalytic domain-containing protein n=1 Tax=Tanacetum cinerariifolium TaxID=118510 RepID=A0A699IMZ3_TANCI|nr:hypothetical protein [Tanacetum cinerariifolium]